ncbi:hypothetical protein JOB18_024566 [Solea senegalensis]|uniref:Uncharacterized protein n=1 Tax=Solea senegalensis TaxID=28829 RepID=A0AAV6PAX5_SOLSE|nr:hypothetical protein JOB18_024566 [Solea senegalensis]
MINLLIVILLFPSSSSTLATSSSSSCGSLFSFLRPAFYSAAPLTSAGIIPIMQSLCPDGQRDEFGFLQYKNSTVTQLLERISEVVEQNRLFTSDRPGLGQELEMLQKHLETLSSTPLPTDYHFNSSQGLNTQPHFDVIFVYLPGFCYRSVNSVDCTKKEPCK